MPLSALLNGAYDTVAGAPSPATSGTSLTVTTAARWPDPAAVGPYPVSLWPSAVAFVNDAGERCMVTAKSGAVLTIVRAIEGSTARTVAIGWQIALAIGAQDVAGLAMVGERNLLVNGGFGFAQRQSPTTETSRADDTYGPDRWIILTEANPVVYSRETDNGIFKSVYNGNVRQSNAAAQRFGLLQIVEGVRSLPMRGEVVRFDFHCAAPIGATNVRFAILEWTSSRDVVTSDVVNNWASGTYTAGNFFVAANVTVAAVGVINANTVNSFASLRATISAFCTNLMVLVWTEGTQAQNNVLRISDAWLVPDAVSQSYVARPVAEELAICQRFYEKSYEQITAPASAAVLGYHAFNAAIVDSGQFVFQQIPFKVSKRVTPAVTIYDAAGNAARISRFTGAGGTRTDNITPSGGPQNVSENAFEISHTDVTAGYGGWAAQWTADSEL